MIRICAWHPKYFGCPLVLGETEPLEDKGETHGLCDECLEKELEEAQHDREVANEHQHQP